jgi:hypothetical protein
MLRTCVLAAALLSLAIPSGAAEQGKTSSWSSEMRLRPPPKPPVFGDELRGNCPGLTVTIKTRIERLKGLQEKAKQQQWPPPTFMAQWERRPTGGDIVRERERIAQLNAALDAKGCQTVDVDAELKRAPAAGTKTK